MACESSDDLAHPTPRLLRGRLSSNSRQRCGFGEAQWIANYGVTCPTIPASPWTTRTLWQYSAAGSISGITGLVDLDESNGALPLYAPSPVTLSTFVAE